MNIVKWMLQNTGPRWVDSTELIYDLQESQSGRSLLYVYQPYRPENASHWSDHGAVLDFVFSAGAGKLLDFGPGDGWPSLPLALRAEHVTGVDASAWRVQVCRENATRLGISNAAFLHVPAGSPLPFDDASFDGAVAASSIEQSPDPEAVIRELCRVLRPGGRLRLMYESLSAYHGREHDIEMMHLQDRTSQVLATWRMIDRETALYAGLRLDAGKAEVAGLLGGGGPVTAGDMTPERLSSVKHLVSDSKFTVLRHASARTLVKWLASAGFSSFRSTHSGARAARTLFATTPVSGRPATLDELDALLAPVVRVVAELEAPLKMDGPITATK
jgi:SAM-dependent methyltransferase